MQFFYPRLRIVFTLFCSFFILTNLQATHNRAGEIIVEMLDCGEPGSELSVKITIITYTKTSSTMADRDSLLLIYGDGTQEYIYRNNGPGNPPQGDPLENDVKLNYYCSTHTYPAYGSYVISMFDRNRNRNVINIPNSVETPFFLQTTYQLVNAGFQGCNSTPILNQAPLDFGCVGEVFTHNPAAIDPDDDSLSFHFTVPLSDVNMEIANYSFPDQIGGLNNNLTIDEIDGTIVWDAPAVAGEYNLAIYVISYRNGIPMDTLLRDMQIIIEDCENTPPTVEIEQEEYCVIAGEVLEFDVIAGAPITDIDQQVRLTATGGPFNFEFNPATFSPENDEFQDDPLVKTFRWETTCDHINSQYYTVVFRALDNFFSSTSGLATLKAVRIKVVGPPPEDVRADFDEDISSDVLVSWELPYSCEDARDDYFRGFTVWRRSTSNQFPFDSCRTGLDGRGYTRISGETPVQQSEDGRYIFLDETAQRGRTYCYRILGEFARQTSNGLFFFNPVSSLPSMEVCVQLSRDIPLITNVDVQSTNTTNGQVELCWTKPSSIELDTILNPGPYIYEILRTTGQTIESEDFTEVIQVFSSDTFAEANDTCFVDTDLNTQDNPFSYQLRFYARETDLIGESGGATSIYLSTAPTDRTNILSWNEIVPWVNIKYEVYRKAPASNTFDLIGETNLQTYRDTGLINGEEYCYYIRSIGSFGVEGIRDPLLNRSQESCEIPYDNVAPCPPELLVESVCEKGIDCRNQEELFNSLSWLNPNDICLDTDDVQGYRIYYEAIEGSDFEEVAIIENGDILFFDHMPPEGIAGCYALTAFDENDNESEFSNIICVDNCPFYDLPNAFTPNQDGQNDLYIPFDYCFVERVEFEVFNRWGQLVFTTQNPDLNWDGTNLRGEDLANGTYFYRCRVFERRVSGIRPALSLLNGYIELLRSKS